MARRARPLFAGGAEAGRAQGQQDRRTGLLADGARPPRRRGEPQSPVASALHAEHTPKQQIDLSEQSLAILASTLRAHLTTAVLVRSF